MTIAYFIGFETGDASELNTLGSGASIQSTTVHSGAYAIDNGSSRSNLILGLSATTSVIRDYFNTDTIPGADTNVLAELATTSTNRLLVIMDSTGALGVVDAASTLGLTRTIGSVILSANQWYRVEVALDLAAGGIVKVWVDGTLSVNTTHSNNVSGTTTDGWAVYGGTGVWAHDDIRIDTGTLTPPGAGRCIARQPITGGTPSGGDAWTKSSGTDAGALWDNTPFDTTDFCSTATASAAQCAVLASFGSTQTGHGSEVLGSSDTINASKIGLVGKTSNAASDGADSIRRRVGGANTDTAITAYTTSNAYRAIAPITGITYANLTDGTTELGTVKTGTGSRTHTVEDVWWFIDYTPAVAAVGSAALAGTGSLSATGLLLAQASAGLVGAGTLAAAGLLIDTQGRSTLSGVGTLSTAGTHTPSGAAVLAGTGTLSANAAHTPGGASVLAGVGLLGAGATLLATATAVLSGVGQLALATTALIVGFVVLSGGGNMAAAASHTPLGEATLGGVGALSASAVVASLSGGQAEFAGIGVIAAAGILVAAGSAAFAGSGSLLADSTVTTGGATINYGVTDGPGISVYAGAVHVKAQGVGRQAVEGIPGDAP